MIKDDLCIVCTCDLISAHGCLVSVWVFVPPRLPACLHVCLLAYLHDVSCLTGRYSRVSAQLGHSPFHHSSPKVQVGDEWMVLVLIVDHGDGSDHDCDADGRSLLR